VPHGQHICLLFQDDAEQLQSIARFFAAALAGKSRILYITDTRSVDEVRRRFAAARVDLTSAQGAEVRTTAEAYFPNGRFEPEVMCDALEAFAREAVATGFTGCRCTGEMGWALRRVPGSERLLEYEAMLTPLIERLPFSGICQYDTRLFDGATILSLLELHPFVLVRGQVMRNPNFVGKAAPRPERPVGDERPAL
jgi:hypothetical protein